MFKVVSFFVAFAAIAYAEEVPGKCPEFTPLQTFDLSSYLGRWYEIMKLPATFEVEQKCIRADYTAIQNSSTTVSVLNSAQWIFDNQPVGILGTATVTDVPGRILVNFPVPVNNTAAYNILDTDYKNYAAVFSCEEMSNSTHTISSQYGWVLARESTLTDEFVLKAWNAFSNIGVKTFSFKKTIQDDTCDY